MTTNARIRRRLVRVPSALAAVVVTGLLALVAVLAAPAASAAEHRSLDWSATLGGRDIGSATSTRPIRLEPAAGTVLTVHVKNTGTVPLTVQAAVLEGRVIGLPFFSYRSQVGMRLKPGQTLDKVVQLDLSDLGDQATGLIPGRVRLLDENRNVLATRNFVVDVHGRALSVYGVFGLVIAITTVLIIIGLVITLLRRRLPENRWQRAMQFLPAGVGIGFVATFSLSASRILAPSPTLWVPLVLVCAAIAFVLGYFAPGPDADGNGDGPSDSGLFGRHGRRAGATVGVGGVAALLAEHQADQGGVGTYDDAGLHGDPGH
jgi:hypothetical protein